MSTEVHPFSTAQINSLGLVVLQLAKAEKLKPLEIELKKLEDLSQSIVNDFAYMRSREEDMRDTNGQFHTALFCGFNLGTLGTLSVLIIDTF